jgi:5-formyltetrahydrofolate cyclo-ligase
MTKAELREQALKDRAALTPAGIVDVSNAIADRFFASVNLEGVRTLSTFIRIPKFNEVDTSAIYYRIWKERPWIRTFAPKTDVGTGTMVNIALFPDTPLVENRWEVREPESGDALDTAELDLVIVPLLAVDASGHRVGYGKGFYDRFLRDCRQDCLKVGLNYFEPLQAIVDLADHDVALDICVTPEEVYRF